MADRPLFPDALTQDAEQLLATFRTKRLKLATAEGCTGGLIAALLTEIPGSSDVFERGFVAYSDAAKVAMLGVSEDVLKTAGPVSEEVAVAMAEGAFWRTHADVGVAATGIAGPGGGTAASPVGLVHVAAVYGNLAPIHRRCRFEASSRGTIRLATVQAALDLARQAIMPTY